MINRIIAEYIKGHKRLVVPDFGAFIRKETGEVVLIEFLKKNDGVLISLIAATKGISEQEAFEAAEQYVAKIKRNIAQSGDYYIEGLGRIYVTPSGFYELEYLAVAEENAEETIAVTMKQAEPQESIATPSAAVSSTNVMQNGDAIQRPTTDEPATRPVVTEATENKLAPGAPTQRTSAAAATPEPARPYTPPNQPIRQPQPAQTARPTEQVRQPQQAQPVRPAYAAPSYRPRPQQQPLPQKKKTDMVMVIAIAAAIIALAAIFFNAVNGSPSKQIVPVTPVEQTPVVNSNTL